MKKTCFRLLACLAVNRRAAAEALAQLALIAAAIFGTSFLCGSLFRLLGVA